MNRADFSDLILELTESATTHSPAAHQARMVRLVGQVARFDAAWWGWSSFARGNTRLVNSDTYNLPRSFESAVRAVSRHDPFIRHGRKLDVFALALVPSQAAVTQEFRVFARAFGLEAMLNGHCRLSESGFNFFMSLYRFDAAQPFTAEEAQEFRLILRHLEQSLSICLRADMRARAPAGEELALVDSEGTVIRAMRGYQAALDREGLDPRRLRSIYRRLAERPDQWQGARVTLQSEPYAPDLNLIRLRSPGAWDLLSRQERRVAELLLAGCSAREIAASFRVSHNTVRNQVTTIYRKTGCSGKLDLARLLLPNL